jgi:hypothetical protein
MPAIEWEDELDHELSAWRIYENGVNIADGIKSKKFYVPIDHLEPGKYIYEITEYLHDGNEEFESPRKFVGHYVKQPKVDMSWLKKWLSLPYSQFLAWLKGEK